MIRKKVAVLSKEERRIRDEQLQEASKELAAAILISAYYKS